MSTLQQLKTYAADVLDVSYAATPDLTSLAASVDAGRVSFAAAAVTVEQLAIQTTGVANLSYEFFTGATVTRSGLDYLVSPTGPNPNNLNSAYYQSFNVENRYINFAVNLGKNGAGAAGFSAAYGALSLSDTVVKAYTTIFGMAPDAAKTYALLNDQVPNGLGGTYTRAQYFASYGGDGPNGLGTKAALVGWLLSAAATEDVGVYAKAEDAFVADLAPDGLAKFNVDLLAAYGAPAPSTPGATISFSPGQSVSTTSADPTLRSTDNADTITGTGGLNAGASVATGNGNDTLTLPGVVTGTVTLGNGNDMVTLGGLGSTAAAVPVLGAPPVQYGSVTLGGGNDTVDLTGGTAAGTTLAASGANNTLHLSAPANTTFAGTITGFQTVYLDSMGAGAGLPATGVQTIYVDIPTTPGATVNAGSGNAGLSEGANQAIVLQNTGEALLVSGSDTTGVSVYLDHYQGAATTQVNSYRGGFSANGGAIIAAESTATPSTTNATLTLHVISDSTAGLITGYTTSQALGPDYTGPLPNLVITGSGALTAQLGVMQQGALTAGAGFQNVDATAAGDLNLFYAVSTTSSAAVAPPVLLLSSGTDNLTVGFTSALSYSSAIAATRFVFGAGTDTFTVAGPSLANLYVTSAQTVYTPSEIDGFKKGVDHLVLDAVTTTLTSGVQAYVGSATTLTQALINVSSHVAANTGAVFVFGGDTYVYQQDSNIGVNTGDGLIRLVGVTGLTTASGSAVGDIHVHG